MSVREMPMIVSPHAKRRMLAGLLCFACGCASFARAKDEAAAGAPVTLAARDADLTQRFHHFEPTVSAPDLAAFWAFDEGSGYEFRDSSGGGHTAHITGANWNTTDSGLTSSFRQQGRGAGESLYLNGSQWLEARGGAPLPAEKGITISAWIKLDTRRAGTTTEVSILRDDARRFDLRLGRMGWLTLVVSDREGRAHKIEFHTPAANVWTHVAGVCDAAGGRLRLYIDGVRAAAVDVAPFEIAPAAAEPPHFHIGRGDGVRSFGGYLDEVTLHAAPLDAEGVRRLYTAGLPKIYAQTRQTIDPERRVWTNYGGNEPVPHPIEPDTIFKASYDHTLASHDGVQPAGGYTPGDAVNSADAARAARPLPLVPARFGGGLDATPAALPPAGLSYASPIKTDAGTIEVWFTPVRDVRDPGRAYKKVLVALTGSEHTLELYSEGGRWKARVGVAGEGLEKSLVVYSDLQRLYLDPPVHLAVTWEARRGWHRLALFVNGTEVARRESTAKASAIFDRTIAVGGAGREAAHGIIDDLHIANRWRRAAEICPRGHVATEAASLDVRDAFSRRAGEPLMLWSSGDRDAMWRYSVADAEDAAVTSGESEEERACLAQENANGFHFARHADARGRMSSAEAGVSFDELPDGWAGVFVRAPGGAISEISGREARAFSGYTFAVNPRRGQMRIAVHGGGRVTTQKTLPYDFPFRPRRAYALTLTAANDGELRGYVDNQNLISMRLPADELTPAEGYAGIFTDGARAKFDDFHFTPLTPARDDSRQVQQRFFSDDAAPEMRARVGESAARAEVSAFRWHKRQGLLPWQRTYKNPQPPGAIFGAADGVARPNESQAWRAEDSANSAVISVDGSVYYFLRGNPRLNDTHGPAQLGALTRPGDRFDGTHFTDESRVLRGHDDRVPDECRDGAPGTLRYKQLQINDEGAAYVGAGRIIVVAREFRNLVRDFPRFSRLVFGIYDVKRQAWETDVVRTVAWSSQSDPTSCRSQFSGVNATPEIVSLRDADTDEYDIYLYHLARAGWEGSRALVSGLRYDGKELILNERLSARPMLAESRDPIYGQRVLFDNGIYYLNYNAATTREKLRQDWPDRYKLAASLHPYRGEWSESRDNADAARPYFARGAEFDFDNAAIWQGAMFKHRGRYYMYFENFHAIEDRDAPYQHYDHLQTGSRVGYATAN